MCGLVGVIAFDPRFSTSPETLRRMSARVAHRGPDGEGIWISSEGAIPNVALGHRRLAILDPQARSDQPFGDDQHRLVYNGELYNFLDLRKELSQRQWQTTGDTEVLLAAYDEWGERCVDRFNGMFAFAIWDANQQSLLLARDPMGQKPLYYTQAPGAVAFASEIGPLLELPWVDQTLDDTSLREYLRWGYVPTPCTIYKGIAQLEPAQTLVITARSQTNRIYFSADAAAPSTQTTRHLVRQAVSRQLVSDVPLGCFLSGGIDSSVIAAAMKAAVSPDQEVLTFSIGFEDPKYDETKFAAAVAEHLKTRHHQFIVRPDAAAILPTISAAFGQPMADSSAIPTYYLAQETRRHVKVALSGDGGDELFGGYDRYRALQLVQSTGQWPWKMAANLLAPFSSVHPKSQLARLKRLAASASLPPAARYSAYMRLFDESLLQSLLIHPAENETDWIEREFESTAANRGAVEAALAVDRRTYLPDDLLTKVDRCSMLHALEVRSPFMDPNLVRFAVGLNADQLLHGGGKRLLREAFAADLPGWVFKRKKMGFAVPIGNWLRQSLRPMLHDLLFAADSFASGHFRRQTLETMIRNHQVRREDHSQRLYGLLMLELWWRTTRR